MAHPFHTLPVVKYVICDDDEETHEADNPQDFEASVTLLEKLRNEGEAMNYTLYAEVEA